MPHARISMIRGRSAAEVDAISLDLYRTLVETFDVPEDDCFQTIEQLELGALRFHRSYMGGPRTDRFVLVALTAAKPRTDGTKRRFYAKLAELLSGIGVPPEDLMVVIMFNSLQDWSSSNGVSAAAATASRGDTAVGRSTSG